MSREEREVSEGKTVFSDFVPFAAFARNPFCFKMLPCAALVALLKDGYSCQMKQTGCLELRPGGIVKICCS
jgi:hypothetical protein